MRLLLTALALLPLAACGQGNEAPANTTAPQFAAASISLPTDEPTLPAGPAGELLTNSCTACHSPDFLMAQPPLKPETWKAEVTKMRSVYHASIAPSDDEKIVAALVDLQKQPRP
ncbi:Cytochrome C nitrite reductase [Sphingomonas sp. EC-HK361]|uniref:cytochrome C nitrite reductase n=1 Tax=Sphingomonas sp. EC-HK361 TaxID=2038397 RepID=UPI0012549524|nr:cytochrome C nitrite reductase [Sphingomonas sp. EC-HK361]VVS97269.1 Cytochrome C nitrite reductase [Sphingomonas sp. EC-HK361]